MAILFEEDFETDGNGTRYTTSHPESVSTLTADFFGRADDDDIGSAYQVSGQSGAYFFGTYDAPDTVVSVTFTGIDISGFDDLEVSGLFAEDDDGSNQDWDADALVYIEVNIDGTGWVKVLQFASGGATNTEPGLDTDFDGIADGPALSDVFASYSASIAGTGTTMDMRIVMENLTSNDEDIAFDLLQVSGTAGAVTVNALVENFDDASQFTGTVFFSDGGSDYYGITDGTTGDFGGDPLPSSDKTYSGATGSYLTGQDLDGEGESLPVVAEWTGIDINGLQNLSFSGDFAEAFDSPGDIDEADYIRVQVRIDGGAYETILEFRGADFTSTSGNFNGNFRLDTDGDGIGDGPTLTEALANFSADIAGTGVELDLRLEISLDAGDEDFAVDNFRVTGDTGGEIVSTVLVDTGDGLAVEEEGVSTDSFTLDLTTMPAADVSVEVTADAQSELSLDGVTYSASVVAVLDGTAPAEIFVRAIDDAIDEANPHSGTVSFTVTSADPDYDGEDIADLTVTIGDNDFTVIGIHDIQGAGDASALVGQEVTVEAVVTGILTGAGGQVGYWLQEEDADADGDAATSEGIFVFSSEPVEVGQVLRVTAEVSEFNDLTELTNVSSTEVLASGATLPSAVQISLGLTEDFEPYEGMRVQLVSDGDDPLTVITNFDLDRFGEVQVAEGTQVQPTMIYDPDTEVAEIQALLDENFANRITIDDSRTDQNPDIYNLIDSGDGTPLEAGDPITADGPTLRLGAEIDNDTGIVGIMDERFGDYRIQVAAPLDVVEETNTGARPDAAPDVGGTLKVASFNVLNYFTTIDEPGAGTGPNGDLDPRGADSPEELARQTAKIVEALIELDADIIGLQELENNGFGDESAIAALVDALNAELGEEVYAYVDDYGADFIGSDAITTGIIYKIDSVSVVGASYIEFEEASNVDTWAIAEQLNPYASSDDQLSNFDRNRPTVAATFEDAEGNQVTVAVSHFKSKGDSNLEDLYLDAVNAGAPQELLDALLADPNYDQGDGQGFWSAVRADAAAELADWLATNPTGATNSKGTLILGDLNSYAMEDSVQSLEGDGYTNLAGAYLGDEAYSYVFDGMQGTLDYGLADGDLLDHVTGVAEWHINTDEPDLLNYDESFTNPAFYNGDDFYAASDHDPMVIGLDLSDPEVETVEVTIDFVKGYGHGHHHYNPCFGYGWGGFGHGNSVTRAVYELDGVVQDVDYVPRYSSGLALDEAGITVTTGGGGWLSANFGSIGVKTPWADHWYEKGLINDEETLTITLEDREGLGDATEVAFEFDQAHGEGEVELAFYLDGELVDEVTLAVTDGTVAYDLEGNQSFDTVVMGVDGDLSLSLGEMSFMRIEEDVLQIV